MKALALNEIQLFGSLSHESCESDLGFKVISQLLIELFDEQLCVEVRWWQTARQMIGLHRLWLLDVLQSHFTDSDSAAVAAIPTQREQHSQVSDRASLIEWRLVLNFSISCSRGGGECEVSGRRESGVLTVCSVSSRNVAVVALPDDICHQKVTADLTCQEQPSLSLSQSSID